jgi:proline dehydrogenase
VGVCVQANLRRTAADVAALAPQLPSIRLVKGAYLEPDGIAWGRKREVDRSYLGLATTLLRDLAGSPACRVAIATHDVRLIRTLTTEAEEMGRPRTSFEVQMLYGIRTEDQMRLAADGFRVRVLISYGDAWFPWYMRRLAERPANVWFVARSLVAR